MSEDEKEYSIKISRLDGYRFEVDFGFDSAETLFVDEDPPQGRNEGPDPSRLLAASIAHCTLSSLLFCVQKSRGSLKGIEATAKIRFGRDINKRLRITGVDIIADVTVPKEEKAKVERCLPMFQDFCTVTESVKRGIPVTTKINLIDEEDAV
jgi:uncharacterized OsmC-like protein